jgi:hypothetical protein
MRHDADAHLRKGVIEKHMLALARNPWTAAVRAETIARYERALKRRPADVLHPADLPRYPARRSRFGVTSPSPSPSFLALRSPSCAPQRSTCLSAVRRQRRKKSSIMRFRSVSDHDV